MKSTKPGKTPSLGSGQSTKLGLRAAAAALDISHVALLKAEKAGRVPKRDAEGLFDVEACRRGLAQNSNLGKQRSARAQQAGDRGQATGDRPESPKLPVLDLADITPETESQAEACRRLEWEKVRKAQRLNDEAEKNLIALPPINAWAAGMIIAARDELLRIGPELRERLAQETDPIECEQMISKRITQALNKLNEFEG
jgi:hypothetical protein